MKQLLRFSIIGLLGAVGLMIGGWWWQQRAVVPQAVSQAAPPASPSAGGVEVTVVPKQLTAGKEMIFEVTLDTHTVELDDDMAEIIRVSDDQGREYKVIDWSGGKGGHHLSGELRVGALQTGAGTIKLEMGGKIGVTKSI